MTETWLTMQRHLLTDNTTTPAATTDFSVGDDRSKTSLPSAISHQSEQIVDSGYVSSEHLLTSRTEHDLDLIGPAPTTTAGSMRGYRFYQSGSVCD